MNGAPQPKDSATEFSETVAVEIHGVLYQMTISIVGGESLCVELEHSADASVWRGEFTSHYIEDITSKTGNFKKFPVFVKMLVSAVKGQSDSVFVDLLTYQDLELLKSKKGRAPPQQNRLIPPSNKRYLIMTYAAEFDRVHYPLPLAYEEHPDPERLKAIIRQLRTENKEMKSASSTIQQPAITAELHKMKSENAALKQRLRLLDRQLDAAATGHTAVGDMENSETRQLTRQLKTVCKERDLLQTKTDAALADLEREKAVHRRELRRKAKEMQEVQSDLERAREQVHELRMKCRDLQGELELSNRRMSQEGRLRATYAPSGVRDKYPSRGPSPQGSRAPSPGSRRPTSAAPQLDRQPSSERVPRPGPQTFTRAQENERLRPSSAPAKNRFDPTEYVKAKKERERQSAERHRTPGRSAASSGRSSPAISRPASAERARPHPRDAGSRQPSMERSRPPARSRTTSAEHQRAEPVSQSGRAAWAEPSYSKFPSQQQQQRTDVNSHVERATSPGKALQDVKAKLSEYVRRQAGSISTVAEPPPAPSTCNPEPELQQSQSAVHVAAAAQASRGDSERKHLYDDASAEIADIDTRLHALQNFLRMAKTTAAT